MKNFNSIWEDIFKQRDPSLYPFDNVVSFVFRNFPKRKPRNKVNILEVGCGGGNNLLFAAKEGFNVFGIDGSKRALEIAQKRFKEENLNGQFIHGDFTSLSYQDDFFDMVIDRCSIVCVNKIAAEQTFKEIYRVLKKKGIFFFNSYSDDHTSFITAETLDNGITTNISRGNLAGNGDLSFYNKAELLNYFSSPWKLKEMKFKKYTNELEDYDSIHSEWELIIEKND